MAGKPGTSGKKKSSKIYPSGITDSIDAPIQSNIKRTFLTDPASAYSTQVQQVFAHHDDKHYLLFTQSHPLRVAWDGVIVVSLLYVFLFLPLEFTYSNPSGGYWGVVGKIVDLIFWIDILVCFRTTYISDDGETIFNEKKIAMHYIKDFFFIDLFCCLPGYPVSVLIEFLLTEPSQSATDSSVALKLGKAPRIIRVVRSVKLVKVLRVLKVMQFLEDMRDSFPASMVFYKMSKLLVYTSFFLHVNACCFSLVGQSQDHGESWTDSFNFEDDWWSEYVNALYWSTTTSTTVGYGDISPVSDTEKGFGIVSMAIGVGVYGYIIGSMTEVVTSMSFVDHQLQERMDQIHEFIKRHSFPPATRRGLLKFYRNHFNKKRYVDEKDIMQLLPPKLLGLVRECVCREGVRAVPLLRYVETKFFPRVMHLLNPRTCVLGEELITAEEDPSPYFYFVTEGHVSIYLPIFEGPFGAQTKKERRNMCMAEVQALHNKFDTDSDGDMDVQELQRLLTTMSKEPVSFKEAKRALQSMDTDNSGTVSLHEFVDWFVRMKVEVASNREIKAPLSTLTLWRPFGLWTAFNLGTGQSTPYLYVSTDASELLTVSAEHLLLEFENDETVLRLVDDTLAGPARAFGMEVDRIPDQMWNACVDALTCRDFSEREDDNIVRERLFGTAIHTSRESLKSAHRRLLAKQAKLKAGIAVIHSQHSARKTGTFAHVTVRAGKLTGILASGAPAPEVKKTPLLASLEPTKTHRGKGATKSATKGASQKVKAVSPIRSSAAQPQSPFKRANPDLGLLRQEMKENMEAVRKFASAANKRHTFLVEEVFKLRTMVEEVVKLKKAM